MITNSTESGDSQNIPKNKTDEKLQNEPSDSVKSSPKNGVEENTEQAPEVSTSTADDIVCQTKPSEEVALILSAEEEAELCANTNEETTKEETKSASVAKPKKSKKQSSKSVWVSNISRSTKATDLKKLFSENFKVESVKIVTNGKNFFGYIILETAEMVQKSVKALNGFNLAGRDIAVSILRPDLRAARSGVGEQVKRGRERQRQSDIKEDQTKKEDKQEEKKDEGNKGNTIDEPTEDKQDNQIVKPKTEDKIKTHQRHETKIDRRDKLIENLKKDLNTANSELRITKRRLRDANNRLEFERSRKAELLKEVAKLESDLRLERRRLNHEKEQTEKQKKLDQLRYEEDRSILNKELGECKRLREYLQIKVDEMRRQRSRSPMRRSPMRREGPGGRRLPERGHGRMDKNQRLRDLHISPPKQRGYETSEDHQHSPPPPPKLNKRPSPQRSRERSPQYKLNNKKPRMNYLPYPSNSSGGNRVPLTNYPPTNSFNGPPRGSMFDPSYKMQYKYNPTPVQPGYAMNQNILMHGPPRPERPLEYTEFHKRIPGGPRKY